jgi:hypothetical protein
VYRRKPPLPDPRVSTIAVVSAPLRTSTVSGKRTDRVCVELDHVRLIPFGHFRYFLQTLAYYTQLGRQTDEDDAQFRERHLSIDREIDVALLEYTWENTALGP